ncbi:hypothetical protein ACFY36_12600 [Actinoplanes sp. NPDC000266]
MRGERELPADLLVDPGVPAADADLLSDALAACGVAARAKVLSPRRAGEQLGWLVLLALPLQAFLTTAGETAARDAYAGLRRAIGRVLGRPPGDPAGAGRPMVLQDEETGLRIVLSADLPAEAYRELVELRLADYREGPLHYDRHERRWRSVPDEIR